MKYLAIVLAALCLGVVTFFTVNSSAANTTPELKDASPAVEEPLLAVVNNRSDGTPVKQVAYYTFDEADGAALSDVVARNNGYVNGKYWRVAGVRSNALVLADAQAEIANQPQLNHDLNAFTLSVWVNLNQDSSVWIDKRDFQNQPKTVEGRFGGTFDHYVPLAGYSLWVSEHPTDGTFINFFINQMEMQFKVSAQYPAAQSLADGEWHQIVVTVQPGYVGGLAVYVDGVGVAWADADALVQSYNSTSPMYLYGRGEIGVDEFQLLDRALSAPEIAERFAAGE